MSNPKGIGGFQLGHAPVSTGRPKSDSALKLAARAYGVRLIHSLAAIALNEKNPPAARVGAALPVLAYGFGKPEARVSMDLDLARKKISELSLPEVREFQAKLAAATIDVAAEEAQADEPTLLDLNEADTAQPLPAIEDDSDDAADDVIDVYAEG
jgi:hypothetical protein